MIDASQPVATPGTMTANPDIYGAEVEGEVQIKTTALPVTFVPAVTVTDRGAAEFVRASVENLFGEGGDSIDVNGSGAASATAIAYADAPSNLRDLGVISDDGLSGVAENVTVMPKTKQADEAGPRPSRAPRHRPRSRAAQGLAAQERL